MDILTTEQANNKGYQVWSDGAEYMTVYYNSDDNTMDYTTGLTSNDYKLNMIEGDFTDKVTAIEYAIKCAEMLGV